MIGILIDTHVISELTKDTPSLQAISFCVEYDDLWLSTIVVHELNFGIELLPLGRRRDRIHSATTDLVSQYSDRILPVGESEANQAAIFRAQRHRIGRNLDIGDALIAGTAKVNGLALATRNIRDFEYLELELIDPWDSR